MNFERARFNLIEQQIRPWMVLDQSVLDLLGRVHRENFVDSSQRGLALSDLALPILVNGKPSGEYMLSPKLEARLLQELAPLRHESVLEIGAGSGYMAALLAHKSRDVLCLDIKPALVELANRQLQANGLGNAKAVLCDGQNPPPGPYDIIMVSGHIAKVPESLLRLLKEGGRLVAITGYTPVLCAERFVRKGEHFVRDTLFECDAPTLLGFDSKPAFSF